MDVKNIFRDLVTNKDMSDYMDNEFSFRTIFYQSTCSFCMCSCGFEHEFVDYVLMSGEINEEMLDKIIQCIVAGECPHVQNVNQEYTSETGVVGRYIAAAVGNKHADIDSIDRFQDRSVRGKLFGLYPHLIAIFKDNYIIPEWPNLTPVDPKIPPNTTIARRVEFNKIEFDCCSSLEVCVRQRNIPLMKHIMGVSTHGLGDALQLALKNKLQTIQDKILTFPLPLELRYQYNVAHSICLCCELAVVYDKPLILQGLINSLREILHANKSLRISNALSRGVAKLLQTAFLLQRNECLHILSSNGFSAPKEIGRSDQVNVLVYLLHEYYDVLKNDVIPLLNETPNVADILNSTIVEYDMIPLYTYIQRPMPNPNCLKVILDLGANVTKPESQRNSHLIRLICEVNILNRCHRAAAELLIFENPELDTHIHSVTHYAIKLDSRYKRHSVPVGVFHMDARLHGLFGYDKDDNFALNFMAPLLIECGFSIPDYIIKSIDAWESKLHPAEFNYFQCCLKTPRSMKHCCRDTLRKHFKGRQIHLFVKKADMPGPIRDFILLKPLLLCVDKHLLSY